MLQGRIADGLLVIEKAIPKAEKDGYKTMADFHRLALAEVYLQIMTGGDKKVPLSKVPLLACTRFRRHRVRCFDGTGGESWRGEDLRESSSLRRCG
jgi:hypothetical protein